MELSNAAGFQPASFAEVGEVDVRIKLLPLLAKQVEVGRIVLHDLTLNLARNTAGMTNWQDLMTQTPPTDKPVSKAQPDHEKSGLAFLSIAGVDIENATIYWLDAREGQTITLRQVRLKSTTSTIGRAFPLQLAFTIYGKKPDINGQFTLNSAVLVDPNKAIYQLQDLRIIFAPLQRDQHPLTVQAKRILADLFHQTLVISDGSLADDHLTEITHLNAKITLHDGLLDVNPLNASVYGGTMQGKVAIDYRGALPKYSIHETLAGIDMTQLVKSGRVRGKANVVTHLALQGQSKDQIIRSLNGTVQFAVQEGALMGTNIPYQVERAIALFKKQPFPPAPAAEDRTPFDLLQGTGTFRDGLFANNDLLIQSKQFKGTGSGSANLISEALDYRLQMVGLQTVANAAGQTTQEERQTPIPVHITGTFNRPIITPDLQVLFRSEVGKKAIEKIQEKIGGDAGKAVGGFLQKILQ